MRFSVKKTVVSLSLALLTLPAVAGFVNETPAGSTSPFESTQQVKLFGGQDIASPVAGIGREVPFGEAVLQIVPRSFSTKMIGIERWQAQPISWQGGPNWVNVLSDAMKSLPEVGIEVDTAMRVVTFRAVAESAHPNDEAASQEAAEWQIRSDDRTIKEALSRWTRLSGWQLIWEIPYEYPVGATATFTGTFEESLENVIKALQSAEVQPQVRFYRGNHVIRIITKGTE